MLYVVAKIFAPLVALLTVSTNFILKRIGLNPEEEEERVSEEEIRMMLEVGNEQGVIKNEEQYEYWVDTLPFYRNVRDEGVVVSE